MSRGVTWCERKATSWIILDPKSTTFVPFDHNFGKVQVGAT